MRTQFQIFELQACSYIVKNNFRYPNITKDGTYHARLDCKLAIHSFFCISAFAKFHQCSLLEEVIGRIPRTLYSFFIRTPMRQYHIIQAVVPRQFGRLPSSKFVRSSKRLVRIRTISAQIRTPWFSSLFLF